ncbi:MAG: ferritin-like domain-containing protein [Rhodocyclaceae bacterium]
MGIKNLNELFVHELSDIYSAEKQLTRALPKMARAATSPALVQAFEHHLEETQGQIERIDRIVELTGIRLKRIKCMAMEGLVEEGKEAIEEIDKGPILDAALIGAGQRVEHYEMAGYNTLSRLARQLGLNDADKLLQETLSEEKAADEKLGLLAQALSDAPQDDAQSAVAAQRSRTSASEGKRTHH